MARRAILIAGLITLMATSAQANGGVFTIGGDVGLVHHIGSVARTVRIVVDITAKQSGIDFTCPLKVALVFLADNNKGNIAKRVFRRNALDSQVILNSVPLSGEAVLFIQTQNINHLCNLTFAASQEGTLPSALMTPGSEADSLDHVPAELAVPVNPAAARVAGLP